MNVLSLFDGISCGQVALERAGIKYNKYFASEIDKYAIQIAQKNYPNTIQLGDVQFVTGHQFDAIGGIDLLIGGSPCQGFSFAGKQLNFKDPRSALFFEFVRLKRELKPKYFLLENVKMKKEYQDVISEYMGVEPIEINSALVSAQNRKRLYWTNIPINKPDDMGILLKDILEQNVNNKYFLNKKQIERAIEKYQSKTWKSGNKMGSMVFPDGVDRKSKCITATQITGDRSVHHIKVSKDLTIKNNQDKASTITGGAHSGGNHSDMDLLIDFSHVNEGLRFYIDKRPTLNARDYKEPRCVAQRGRYNENGDIEQNLEPRLDNKTNSLTTVQKDNMLLNDYSIRRLTPIECERLQTLPDDYTKGISDTQRYKALGNGWTVDVIAHIFSHIK